MEFISIGKKEEKLNFYLKKKKDMTTKGFWQKLIDLHESSKLGRKFFLLAKRA